MKKIIISWVKVAIHNCLIHPLIPFIPKACAAQLHERNGKWAYSEDEDESGKLE
jgi:hypothetical protein